jgi:hypothetical protein
LADIADIGNPESINDRRQSPRRGNDRRNLAARVPGLWTAAQREAYFAEQKARRGELGTSGGDSSISDRRRSQSRGKDRRDLSTRLPGTWTEEERRRFIAERNRRMAEMVADDPRRI